MSDKDFIKNVMSLYCGISENKEESFMYGYEFAMGQITSLLRHWPDLNILERENDHALFSHAKESEKFHINSAISALRTVFDLHVELCQKSGRNPPAWLNDKDKILDQLKTK